MPKQQQKKVSQLTLQEQYQTCPRANLLKRLGAYIYDLLALTALLMFAVIFALAVIFLFDKVGLIAISSYQDPASYLAQSSLFSAYLAIVIIGFYAYFWSKGGQTIGMKAWRLRVQNSDGSNISFTQALIRVATSAFGLGNLMALLKSRNAFQDLWAECEVIVLSKELSNWKGFKGMGFMDEDKKE